MTVAIIVHGGAGSWEKSAHRFSDAQEACAAAAEAGRQILIQGGSALDAVEAAIMILEDHPVLDAGRGSYPNVNGDIEMDAIIMDGKTLELGAVAAIQRVRHPIQLARRIMMECTHQFLVGDGADAFADSIGFPRCDVSELLVSEAIELVDEFDRPITTPTLGDTVGAVAIDANGNLAAATSTGGTANKLPGRVGDSPLVGSGAYADNWTAAASATGHGEMLMRIVISKRVCDFVSNGLSAKAACESTIQVLEERTGGQGGLIAVDARGQVGYAFNTKAMPLAYAINNFPVEIGGR